jgi:hypothetical protein
LNPGAREALNGPNFSSPGVVPSLPSYIWQVRLAVTCPVVRFPKSEQVVSPSPTVKSLEAISGIGGVPIASAKVYAKSNGIRSGPDDFVRWPVSRYKEPWHPHLADRNTESSFAF